MARPGGAEDFLENPIGRRNPAMHFSKHVAVRSPKPTELGRPIGSPQHAASLLVDFSLAEFLSQDIVIRQGARIRPGKHGSDRPRFSVEPEKAVPERAAAHGYNLALRWQASQGFAQTSTHRAA